MNLYPIQSKVWQRSWKSIGHNSALIAAVLDFGKGQMFTKDPFTTLKRMSKINDAMDNKGDIVQNVENRPYSGLTAAILDFGKGQLYQK